MERLNPQLKKAEVALNASYKRGYLIWGGLLAGGVNIGFWAYVVDLKAGAIASGFELGAVALQFREWTVQSANIRKLKMAGFEVNRKYWVFGREITGRPQEN